MATTALQASGSGGIYYALACVGSYTSVESGACSNASSPLSQRCAWGLGDSCQLCPRGALCPGGQRLWPRPGFWASSESALPEDLVACAEPDAFMRCPGSLAAGALAGSFPCGAGYRTGTVGCAGCADGFYPTSSGACEACPAVGFVTGIVLPIAQVVGGAALVTAALATLVHLLTRRSGGTLRGSLERTMQLVAWLWMALQVLVQAGRAAQTTAPPALSAFFRGLAVLQFEGVAANQACLSAFPFVTQWSQLGLIAALYTLLFAAAVSKAAIARGCWLRQSPLKSQPPHPQRCLWLVALAGLSLKALLVFFAMVSNTVLTMLTCTNASLTVRGYFALAQDGQALLAAATAAQGSSGALSSGSTALLAPGGFSLLSAYARGAVQLRALPPMLAASAGALLNAPLTVPVLASDPFTVCYEAQHARLYRACWAAFVLYCLAFPLASLVGVYTRLDARMRSVSVVGSERAAQWNRVRGVWHPLLGRLAACLRGERELGTYSEAQQLHQVRVLAHDNPLRAAAAAAHDASPCGAVAAEPPLAPEENALAAARMLLDSSPKATSESLLAGWTVGNTVPSRFAFTQLDQVVLIVLSVSVAYNTQSSGFGGRSLDALLVTQAGGLAASLIVTLAAAVLVWRAAPFPAAFAWKTRIKASIYLLAGLSAVTYFVSWWSAVVARPCDVFSCAPRPRNGPLSACSWCRCTVASRAACALPLIPSQ